MAENPYPTVTGSRGGGELVRSPGFLALRDAALLVRQLGAELGLTPTGRERVSRSESAPTSLADLMGDA